MRSLRCLLLSVVILFSPFIFAQEVIEANHRGLNLNSALQTLEQATASSYILSNEIKKNNVNVIFVWASWCDVCKGMMPRLFENYQKIKKCSTGLHFIAIKDNAAAANKDLASLAPGHSTLVDEKGFLKNLLNIRKIPTILIVDSKGSVLNVITGGAALRFPKKMSEKHKDESCAKQ